MALPRCTCCRKVNLKKFLVKHKLLIATFVAVFLGITFGFALRPLNLSDEAIMWIGIWGQLFMRMLKMIIIPLVVSSLVVGVASLEAKTSGKIGGLTLGYIVITQVISIVLGAIMAATIQPGKHFSIDASVETKRQGEGHYADAFADFLRNLFPDNLIQACFSQIKTTRKLVDVNVTANTTQLVAEVGLIPGTNVLGLVVFSCALGIGIVAAGDVAKPLFNLCNAIYEVIFKILVAIIWYSPVGITSLIMASLLKVKDISGALQGLGFLTLAVVVGLVIHFFIILPLVLFFFFRTNPFKYHYAFLESILTGFAPPSSSAAFPYLVKACDEKLAVDTRVTNFVIPVAVMTNRDGSVLYIMVVTMFIAQSLGIPLNAGQLVIAGLLLLGLSLGLASTPSGSLITLMLLGSSINLPISDGMIGMLLSLDWLLDRLRTVTNVLSHGVCCVVVERLCVKDLAALPNQAANEEFKNQENNEDAVIDGVVVNNRKDWEPKVNGAGDHADTSLLHLKSDQIV